MKLIAGLCAALVISTVSVLASAQAPGNVVEEITVVGCLREWRPATDVTRLPESTGIYVLTPIASSPTATSDLPTYLLTPSLTMNFPAHLDDKVEMVGVAQAAPVRRTFVGSLSAITPRPEERPTTETMPRLTVKTLRKISDACPS